MRISILFSALVILLTGCKSDPLDVDVSEVSVDIDYLNYDSVLFSSHSETAVAELEQTDQEAVDYLFGYCLGMGRTTDTGFFRRLEAFRQEPYIVQLHTAIEKKFSDLSQRHATVIDGFRHLKKHFPDVALPKTIVYANSYFSSSAFSAEKSEIVGLERYLGGNHPLIEQLPTEQFYQWIKEGLNPEFLERDILASWILTHLMQEQDADAKVYEEMIYWGKALYMVEAAFPEKEQHIIMRWSATDFEWANAHLTEFWTAIGQQNMLLTGDPKVKANLTHEGPFTPGFPEEGPDRMGQFLGWKIVHSYMEQYDVTLQELLKLPANELLQEFELD